MSAGKKFFLLLLLLAIILFLGGILNNAFGGPKENVYNLSGIKDISKSQVILSDGKSYPLDMVLNALIKGQLIIESKMNGTN